MYSKWPIKLAHCILIYALFPPVAHATQPDSGIGFYFDQDLLVPLYNEDRDYTMGFAMEFFWAKEKGLYPLDNLVRKAGNWLNMDRSKKEIIYSFMLGTIAYTPDDLSDSSPISNDRPYSSLIYFSNKRVLAGHEKALAAEILLGVLGTDVAKVTQTKLHTLYRSASDSDEPVNPQGWSHQISDGGEITTRLRLSISDLLVESKSPWPGQYDVATSYGLSLGYQTNVNVGIAIRAGKIKSAFWSLPFDPVNRGNFLPSRSKNEWYFWSAFRAHLVAYDALLQGQFKNSDVTYSADQIERLVYDGAIGLTAGYKGSQITFSANSKTSDLKNTDRRQVWGSINFLHHL